MYIRNCHAQKTYEAEMQRGKGEHAFIKRSSSNKTPQRINGQENLWGYRLGTVTGV
jgi:hypothetical protein